VKRLLAILAIGLLWLAVGADAVADDAKAMLGGQVINLDTRAPVVGASVKAFDGVTERLLANATTDETGAFSMDGLSGGWVVLTVSHPSYFGLTTVGVRITGSKVDLEKPIQLYPSNTKRVFQPGPVVESKVITPPREPVAVPNGPALTGIVTRSDTHVPVAGAVAAAYIAPHPEARAAAVTGTNGRFAILGLPSGTYTVRVTSQAFAPQIIDDVRLNIVALTILPPIELQPAVKVLDDRTMFRRAECGNLIQVGQTADVYIVCGW
jgi:hypothetical protein